MKRIAALILFFFLAAQALGFLHNAEHGFAKHNHYGKVCGIYLHCEHQKASGAAMALLALPEQNKVFISLLYENLFSCFLQNHYLTRAPPLFS